MADPLAARALVVDPCDGTGPLAVVATDLIGIPGPFAEKVRASAGDLAGIRPERLVLCATHTHFVPRVAGLQLSSGEGAPVPVILRWSESLVDRIAGAVAEAARSMEPARAFVAAGELPEAHYNRRTRTADGSVVTSFRWPANPDEFEFRPCDDSVTVLKVSADEGDGGPGCERIIASVVVYACHAVCGSIDSALEFSADHPGVTSRLVGEVTGAPCLYLSGPAGDVVPRIRGRRGRMAVGEAVAGEALRLLRWPAAELTGAPVTALRRFDLERKARPSREEAEAKLREAEDKAASSPGGESEAVVEMWRGRLGKVDAAIAEWTPHLSTEVMALRWGPLGMATMGGEITTPVGAAFKERAAAEFPALVSLANGHCGYVLAADDLPRGGYEAGVSRLAAGAAEKLVDEAVSLLASLG